MALLRVACVGGGGHCRSVLAYMVNAPHLDVVGVLDGGRAVGEVVLKEDEGREVRVVGTDREPESFADLDGVVVTIGDNAIRKRVVERLKAFTGRDGKPLQFPSVVHPRAFVSPGVAIGPGTVVHADVFVDVGSRVGSFCVINNRSVVCHDCVMEDFSFVAPGVTLCGTVALGEGAMVAAGATVNQQISIGKGSLVGAGSVVVRSVPDLTLVLGVPGKAVRTRQADERFLRTSAS